MTSPQVTHLIAFKWASSVDVLTELVQCGGKHCIKPASSNFSFIINISRLNQTKTGAYEADD